MPDIIRIFDTAVLSNFYLAQADHLLAARYKGKMAIPGQVYDEIDAAKQRMPVINQLDREIAQKKIRLISLDAKERTAYHALIQRLGKGESACIAAACKRSWIVATDDRAARAECGAAGVQVTGTIGILKAMCADKQISPAIADKTLDRMIARGYYSPVNKISALL